MRKLENVAHIHFIGICGYAMSGAAVMAKERGYRVTGSDQDAYPPSTEIVNQAGIKWYKKYSPSNLDAPDLVIIGNHIRSDNSEAQSAIKRGLEIISLPELIGKVFANKKRIVIAGTHGKTTTTSLVAWVLETAGLNPSYLIGGIMQNTGKGFKLGKGNFLVVEGDEYRTAFFDQTPKLFHYRPEITVLTSCELDHPDYFKNLLAVKKVFLKFLDLVPKDGLIVGGIDDPSVAEILKKIKKPKISYGLNKKAKYRGFDIKFGKKLVSFKVKKDNKLLGEFKLLLPGKINVQNALAAIAVTHSLGVDLERIRKGIESFKGVKRRFEIVGNSGGITIIDDYAHHPTKIKKTLAAARTRYKENKIYCVFEPHTYSRTKALLADYARSFEEADEVIVTSLMPAREKDQKPTITSGEVVRAIKKHHPNVRLIPDSSEILAYLTAKAKKDDVVIVMSVGGLDNLARKLALFEILGGEVRLNEQLAKYTTFKIGGPADLFLVAKNLKELEKAALSAKKLQVPYFVLGRGSNLLASDKGFRGLVIKCQTSKIKHKKNNLIQAESGVLTNHLVRYTLDKGLAGLEHFFGLPGTIGGAVYGKAHFKGHFINGKVFRIEKLGDIILSVVFKLEPGNKKELWKIAKGALKYRKKTQPLDFPSAGCIFKNPDSQAAGYLIEKCGLKGTKIGGAMIAKKHANFIVNTGKATSKDVLRLIELCQKRVKEKFGIKLVEEIVKMGDFNG